MQWTFLLVRHHRGFDRADFFLFASSWAILAWLVTSTMGQAAEPPTAAESLFLRSVYPTLREKCFACHGTDVNKRQAELDLSSRAGMLQGGESGEAALVPGLPEQSSLFLAATRQSDDWSAMPPKENDRLSEAQLQDLETWIRTGAVLPDADRMRSLEQQRNLWDVADGIQVTTSGGLSPEWTNRRYQTADLWCWQPIPDFTDASETERDVDWFIDLRLNELELPAAPLADRRTLIRRATFDLLGLPPTPQEVADFLADPADDATAFRNLVNRLLASPQYGEQWGRHWLDVVRYADSAGFANDFERGNAWRYRDYVIRSFNADKPYDQFIREQIAGDELFPENPEALVATGFLRMGAWELTGMEVAKVARQRYLDDVTDTVGQVFLGQMLQCARCHDHKFDPVPTRDYYGMQAFFATTQLAEREVPFLPSENTSGFEEKKYLEQRRQHYQRELNRLDQKNTLAAARAWLQEMQRDATPFERVVQDLQQKDPKWTEADLLTKVRKAMQQQKIHPDLIPPPKVGFAPADYGLERIARKGIERLRWSLERYQPFAHAVYSGLSPDLKAVYTPLRMPSNPLVKGELEQIHILAGGDPFSPTLPTPPQVLSAVAGIRQQFVPVSTTAEPQPNRDAGAVVAQGIVGRRAVLADWLTDPENPLPARVMVNRIWQGHFGQGIAGNPNNFGTTGKKPTHPELLDWLARQFLQNGGSVKQMHRLIMNSMAYRRSAAHPDPESLALTESAGPSYAAFRPRRLTAEELRDAILFASGELNRTLGGIPCRPEIHPEVALQPRQVMGTFAEAWQPSPLPEQRHRRTIYTFRLRGLRDPFLEVFNAPSPENCCEQRDSATTTPQVFSLFNASNSYHRALASAHWLQQQGKTPAETIQLAFQCFYQRDPAERELQRCLSHWQQMTDRHRQLTFTTTLPPKEVERHAVDENTGERFQFVEPLEASADFVPDLQPAAAEPQTRGLAEVCLILFNSNEFVYVY